VIRILLMASSPWEAETLGLITDSAIWIKLNGQKRCRCK
jgi:hypothetical protein